MVVFFGRPVSTTTTTHATLLRYLTYRPFYSILFYPTTIITSTDRQTESTANQHTPNCYFFDKKINVVTSPMSRLRYRYDETTGTVSFSDHGTMCYRYRLSNIDWLFSQFFSEK